MNAHDLKQLQVRRTKLEAELFRLDQERKDAQRAHNEAQKKLKEIDAELEKATTTTKKLIVSEHAMLRYVERVLGLDFAQLEQGMFSPATLGMIAKLGNGKYPVEAGDGARAIVKDNVVITIESSK